jgi:low affinity Fe/Cu permease
MIWALVFTYTLLVALAICVIISTVFVKNLIIKKDEEIKEKISKLSKDIDDLREIYRKDILNILGEFKKMLK